MRIVAVLVAMAVAMAGAHADRRRKPTAPLRLTLARAGDTVTLTATATRAVPTLELALGGERRRFGPTRAGETRVLTLDIAGRAAVALVGSARAGGRSAVARLALGPVQHAPRPTTTVTLPDGRRVSETR